MSGILRPYQGEACVITLITDQLTTFGYQTTNGADNSVSGSANTPVALAVGEGQSYVMSFTMTGACTTTDIAPEFFCSNRGAAAVFSGLNTILLTSAATAVPDVVAIAATLGNDGYADIDGVNGTGVFSVATSTLVIRASYR